MLLFNPEPKEPDPDNTDGVLAFVVLTLVMWVVIVVYHMVRS